MDCRGKYGLRRGCRPADIGRSSLAQFRRVGTVALLADHRLKGLADCFCCVDHLFLRVEMFGGKGGIGPVKNQDGLRRVFTVYYLSMFLALPRTRQLLLNENRIIASFV